MTEDNCTYCLFSEHDQTSMMIDDLLSRKGYQTNHTKHMKCANESSPYYDELVNEKMCCRQFINSKEYFKNKDKRKMGKK